jgi:hypothetical protein
MGQEVPSLGTRAATYARLGLTNLIRVAAHRLLVKARVYKHLLPVAPRLRGPFFDWSASVAGSPSEIDNRAWIADGERVLGGELPVFSHEWKRLGFPPSWRRSVTADVELPAAQPHWSQVPVFSLPGGDIKGYWESSRFDGLLILALAWVTSRDARFSAGIEAWLDSWCAENPANYGVQWNCGQEASLRLMHVLTVVLLLDRWGGVRALGGLRALVAQHCARIAPTLMYAVGQDNNHGTSEAAALFAGGAFLESTGGAPGSCTWRATGRRLLRERVLRLVMPDGSFSQHSTNYHRLMLDTCSMAEYFRRAWAQPEFDAQFVVRCRAATAWLEAFIDPVSGDVPNLGANDGARIFVLHRRPYRDFRPSVQLAAEMFEGRTAFDPAQQGETLRWLGVVQEPLGESARGESRLWPDGGYAKLTRGDTWLLLRLPRYRFRPSHSDALHLDLWRHGVNVLRDGGSYSYNAGGKWPEYFSGVASHNTIEFDGHDQMPRISRFLFGAWLHCAEPDFDAERGQVMGAYTNSRGVRHERAVRLADDRCVVTDTISGFAEHAVLRWRLPAGTPCVLHGDTWHCGALRVRVASSMPVLRREVTDGWESLYYFTQSQLPVIELEFGQAGTITTEISWEDMYS